MQSYAVPLLVWKVHLPPPCMKKIFFADLDDLGHGKTSAWHLGMPSKKKIAYNETFAYSGGRGVKKIPIISHFINGTFLKGRRGLKPLISCLILEKRIAKKEKTHKRGTAKSTFICEESRKMAPSGQNWPKLRMEGANGIRFPWKKKLKPCGLWPPIFIFWPLSRTS